jgi:hypothetical protein
MSLQIIEELLEDADVLGYIKAGADHNQYDRAAKKIFDKLSIDLSVAQIEKIIWESFYSDFLVCTVGNSNDYFAVDQKQAGYILGEPSRFSGIAKNIRHIVYKL